MKIGFIGQGFIGKAYSDDFESRGYVVIRYAQEEPHVRNKEKIAECDIVFIAVPTPTTPEGFNDSIVREVLALIGKDKIAVIKSTLLPGTTDRFQEEFPDIFLMHSPEFLRAKTATEDARNPNRNIIGYTERSKEYAEKVLAILPTAPYNKIVPVKSAELIKYMNNVFLTQKVLFANCMYELADTLGIDYETVRDAVGNDPRITPSHLGIDDGGGRGAGGFCFIKDLAVFTSFYEKTVPHDPKGVAIFVALEKKNISLLKNAQKDIDLLKGVYGEDLFEEED